MGYRMTNERSGIAFLRTLARDARPVNDGLPPPRSNHWVARQKRAVVEAVNCGRLPLREAMRRYELSIEEFLTWQEAYGDGNNLRAERERVLEKLY